jgi:hypothetical protein
MKMGLRLLVMGGHAVRHYGISRDTFDFDFHLSFPAADHLVASLHESGLFGVAAPRELPGWRGGDFRRFLLGHSPDGKEEYLEFWLRNHLLPPFDELYARREEGEINGHRLPFLSLADLIRSKETERESDWQDIALLEEILDARNLSRANDPGTALAELRSRRGYRMAESRGLLHRPEHVCAALAAARNPIPRSFLLPFVPNASRECVEGIPDLIAAPLRSVVPGSARHLALVEAMRRVYRQNAIAADRADKARFRQMT